MSGIGGFRRKAFEPRALTWVALAVIRLWFFTRWTAYDPYDPDGSFP